MIDILSAMIEILKANADIMALVNDRVYGENLPRSEVSNLPRKNIVLVSMGGIEQSGTSPLLKRRFDVWCYGETLYEAKALEGVVFETIKNINRVIVVNTLIHSVALSGGPRKYVDPTTEYPAMIQSISVTADERTVTI